jgi:putative exosortase-associated protein (TIGR04073 family)
MRKTLSLLGTLVFVALLGTGCEGPERKLGRGLGNMMEIVRGSEFERGVEQGGLFDGPDAGITTGLVSGISHTFARTGLGFYEVVTAPIPSYDPIWTSYLTPKPEYPDSYAPSKFADAIFDTDHYFGFSGGDVAPWFLGSHFRVFDN